MRTSPDTNFTPRPRELAGVAPGEASNPLVDFFRCPDSYVPLEEVSRADLAWRVEWLRLERYVVPEKGLRGLLNTGVLSELYYATRPFIPSELRTFAQRVYFRDWSRRDFPRWPVDTSVEDLLENALRAALAASGRRSVPFVWFWPSRATAAALVTHDVETAHGLEYLDILLDLDRSFAVPASVQLVPEGRYAISQALVDRLRTGGWEVNLHGLDHEGNLFSDPERFARDLDAINTYLERYQMCGFRSPCMYRNPALIDELNIRFDLSIPNVAHLEPQRGGCCTVFPYWLGRVLELPLTTVQDYGLFRVLGERSIELWRQQVEIIRARHGLMSFIVHPDYARAANEREMYRQLLQHLSELADHSGVWKATAGQIDQWWRERQRLTLVQNEGGWRVAGDGADRAAVAWAHLEDGRLTYELPAESRD